MDPGWLGLSKTVTGLAAAPAVDSVDKPAIDSIAAMLVVEIQPGLGREQLNCVFHYTAIAHSSRRWGADILQGTPELGSCELEAST